MTVEPVTLRLAYVDALIELAKDRDDFVVLDADSREATQVDKFGNKYPDRAFSFGIAEQNMVAAAGGFATVGFIPLAHTYAQFIAGRALDQVRNTVAYANLNVKLVASHCGLDVGQDGVTHQTLEDFAAMRTIPRMIVLSPADDIEMRQVTRYMLDNPGPTYVRIGKSKVPRVHDEKYQFELGRPNVLRQGTDVTIFAVGVMVQHALKAGEELAAAGISALIANCATIKPMQKDVVLELARKTGAVVTAEDHSIYGGLGGAVAELLAGSSPLPMEYVGVKDRFCEAGTPAELFDRYGLSPRYIVDAAKAAVKRKKSA